jgi:hypothetical protein
MSDEPIDININKPLLFLAGGTLGALTGGWQWYVLAAVLLSAIVVGLFLIVMRQRPVGSRLHVKTPRGRRHTWVKEG